MSTSKTTSTTATKTTTQETQRVTSLEAREGRMLSSLEESVVRMHHGVSVKAGAALPTNGVNDEVMTQLLEMELRAFEATGLIDELDDVPEGAVLNEATTRIVAELKKKL